jgi:hypothetical protein
LQEVIEAAPFGFDLLEKLSFGSRLIRRNTVPEEGMIPMLKGVV